MTDNELKKEMLKLWDRFMYVDIEEYDINKLDDAINYYRDNFPEITNEDILKKYEIWMFG